jgi:hypothetical protein
MEAQSLTKLGGEGFGIDSPLMDGTIVVEAPFGYSSKGTQEVSQASPHSFNGIGMHFIDSVLILILSPLFTAMIHRLVYSLILLQVRVAFPFIGMNCT